MAMQEHQRFKSDQKEYQDFLKRRRNTTLDVQDDPYEETLLFPKKISPPGRSGLETATKHNSKTNIPSPVSNFYCKGYKSEHKFMNNGIYQRESQ